MVTFEINGGLMSTKKYTYQTEGVCSTQMHFEIVDGNMHDLVVENGCNGNLQGISKLVEGRPAAEVAELLKGIRCGWHDSCPNQLSVAIEKCLAE
jgi:uncharacterized protein (TIGR03905 family)